MFLHLVKEDTDVFHLLTRTQRYKSRQLLMLRCNSFDTILLLLMISQLSTKGFNVGNEASTSLSRPYTALGNFTALPWGARTHCSTRYRQVLLRAIKNNAKSELDLDEHLQRLSTQTANDEAYQECSAFLRSIGIDNRAEIARVMDIATNPNSIYHTFQGKQRESNSMARKLSVDEDLKPLVTYFEGEGLTIKEIAKVIVEYPPVLCYSPESKIKPFLDYLRSLGIASPGATIHLRPSLLGLDGEKSLRQIVDYLQQNDYTPEQIEHLLATSL